MSLNKWILEKEKEEIILEKIKKEIQKAFLTKKGTEFKCEKRFWIETLIRLIAKNLNLKEETVRKHVEILLLDCFILKDHMAHVYYYPEITKDYKETLKNITEGLGLGFTSNHDDILRMFVSLSR